MGPVLKSYLRPARNAARFVANEVLDVYDGVRGARHPLVPRRNDIFIGAGSFLAAGTEFFRYLTELAGLRPTDRVLDVGCGLGRMAVPLTTYLKPPAGRYDGFDIVPKGIEWCRERFTPRYPNFGFVLADVYNTHYNPTGRYRASEYRFPYDDATFDLVFLTSVFTHMMTDEVVRYLEEIARVTKPGGRCLVTMFLLNDESRALMTGRTSRFDFRYGTGEVRYAVETVPEDAVAYDEAFVLNLFARCGFEVSPPVRYGSWCGRRDHLSFQDIIIATRV